MQILTARHDVLEALETARQIACPIFCPNAETPDEIEGLLLAADDYRKQTNQPRIVIGMGITASYPDHPQLQFLACDQANDLRPILHTWLGWIKVHANRPGHFDDVDVIPFLDHGWMPHDVDLQLMRDSEVIDSLGIIMFDASALELEQNIQHTSEYVQLAGSRVVIEACPDKILSEAQIIQRQLSAEDMLTDPEQAANFVQQTGVDLIVPNLGTEHRATGHQVRYHADIARELLQRVGPRLSLHGTSSLGNRITHLAGDGIIKVNFYTAMARTATQQVRHMLEQTPVDQPLPIADACGSRLHAIRRQAVRQTALNMLQQLASPCLHP